MHSRIEQIYVEYFKDTFDNLGLKRHAEDKWSIEFKNESFRVQLLDDRGLIELGIGPNFDNASFINVELCNALVTFLKFPDELNASERRKILRTRLDFKAQALFIVDNFERLNEMLSTSNYLITFDQINTLRKIDSPF